MEKVVAFKTKLQKEYDEVCERANKNLEEYTKLLEQKTLKYKWKGDLTEADIDEILMGIGKISKDSNEKRQLLKKINPEVAAYIEKLDKKIMREAWEKAREEYYEKEYGLRVVE